MMDEARQDLLSIQILQICIGKVVVEIMIQTSGSLDFELRMQGLNHINVCLFHGSEVWVLAKPGRLVRYLFTNARGEWAAICDESGSHHVNIYQRYLPVETSQNYFEHMDIKRVF